MKSAVIIGKIGLVLFADHAINANRSGLSNLTGSR